MLLMLLYSNETEYDGLMPNKILLCKDSEAITVIAKSISAAGSCMADFNFVLDKSLFCLKLTL